MPLLGYKVFHLSAPPSSVDTDGSVFVIKHTNEIFKSKDEYQKRVALYKASVWTCQCTGQLNLTHEEACLSERNARESLREAYPSHYEQPVLERVHHSTEKLDHIVDKCWQLFHETFVINEPITLKVKANGRQFSGRVVRIDKGSAVPNGDCSSPSSDKENKASGTDGESPKGKWKPKLLPYSYSMKLANEEKIVNGIPAADIERVGRPPSKELLRLFIRAHAVRYGSLASSPWVVDDKLVSKLGLKDRCPDLDVHKERQQDAIEKAIDDILRKRKSDSKDVKSPPSKKLKLSDSAKAKKSTEKKKKDERKSPHKQSTLNFSSAKSPKMDLDKCDTKSPKKTSQKSPKKSSEIVVSDSSDDECLSQKRTKMLNGECDSSARTTSQESSAQSSDEDLTLADVRRKSPGKPGAGRKQKLKTKSNVLLNRKGEETKPKKKRNKDKEKEKKLTKQLTLFGVGAVKKDGTPIKTTPKNSPAKQGTPRSPFRTPRICLKIQKAMKTDDKLLVKKLTLQAARELNSKQVKLMPEGELKNSIEAKIQFIADRQRLKLMTPEERLEHKKKKMAEVRAKAKEYQAGLRQRFEDLEIEGSPLPKPKLVPTPDGLPNECFGDVAMITEFLAAYKDLLMPDEKTCPFSGAELIKALGAGEEGFTFMSKVLIVILQTLLQDQIAEDYKELRCQLSDIPVNCYTASEIVRLCLRKHDHVPTQNGQDEDEEEEEDDEEIADELIEQLDSSEFSELDARHKLAILRGLCSRVLGTYSVQDFMEQRQKELAKVWKQRIKCLKEKNDDLKKKKEEKKSQPDEAKQNGNEEGTLLSLMKSPEKELDLATKVKRRRELAAKSAQEREEREKEQKRIRQQELDEYKKQVRREQMEKNFEEVVGKARVATRQVPIGTDRNHDRYWVFSSSLPGLYVEKGWVTENITYNVRAEAGEKEKESDSESDSDSEDEEKGKEGEERREEKRAEKERRKKDNIEKTTPHSGQNLWFVYDTREEVDQLLAKLHKQGVRESDLKTQIQKHMSTIMPEPKCPTPGCDGRGNVNKYFKTHTTVATCPNKVKPESADEEEEEEEEEEKKEEKMETDEDEPKVSLVTQMLEGFKKELMDTEMRLRNGGLGGVPDFDVWEAKLMSSETLQTAGQCLVETQDCVQDRFLDGMMQRKKTKTAPGGDDSKESKDLDEEQKEPEEELARGVVDWREAIEGATTWSRLHVLLGVLDSCVKWEKSAEHAKCKICRKKKDDYEELILCDECNQPFHLYCLRPALFSVPRGDWFCPACIPTSQKRRTRQPTRYDEASESEAEDEPKDENCCMCGGDEGLVSCSKCPCAYHLDCHDPPLRHTPRGRWECQPCKSGIPLRKRQKARQAKVKRPPPTKRRQESSSSEEEESEEEEEDDDEETDEEVQQAIEQATSTGRQRNRQTATQASSVRSSGRARKPSRRVVESEESEEEEEEEEEEEDEDESPKRGSRRARTSSGPKSVDPQIFGEITTRLYRHRSSWPFREPVDPEEVPDYYEIIAQPVTLLDLQERCAEDEYQRVDDFVRDVVLLFNNAQEYNRSDSDVYQCMCTLEKYFKETIEKLIPHYSYEREFAVSTTSSSASSRRRSSTAR